jgi:hypothetical protein
VFAPGSRYEGIPIAEVTVTAPDGSSRTVRYVQRRVIPRADAHQAIVDHLVAPGDRLDLVTARYLGDPTQYWRLCDANGVLSPDELEQVGRVITIAIRKS